MSHFVKQCVHGKVQTQCRCSGDKRIIIVPCTSSCASAPRIAVNLTVDQLLLLVRAIERSNGINARYLEKILKEAHQKLKTIVTSE